MVETSGHTTFGGEQFLRVSMQIEGLAANLQISLTGKWPLDF